MYTIYGRSICPNCKKAVDLLESKGLEYRYVNLEDDIEKFMELKSKGLRSVPYIELDGVKVGGYEDLVKGL